MDAPNAHPVPNAQNAATVLAAALSAKTAITPTPRPHKGKVRLARRNQPEASSAQTLPSVNAKAATRPAKAVMDVAAEAVVEAAVVVVLARTTAAVHWPVKASKANSDSPMHHKQIWLICQRANAPKAAMRKPRMDTVVMPTRCVNSVHVTAMVASVVLAKSAQTVPTARTCVSLQTHRRRQSLHPRLQLHPWRNRLRRRNWRQLRRV